MRIAAIINEIERFAPPFLQEKWDNTGLQVGSGAVECTGVLVCFDVTPAVVEEAAALGCNLIISHHPLFFKPVKALIGSTPQQVCAINAIAAGISIYSSHTAADSTKGGVSYELARLLGVTLVRVLAPLSERLLCLRVFVPAAHVEEVRMALFDAGAGTVGCYDSCSFAVQGEGTFRPLEGAHPFLGNVGELSSEKEIALDFTVTSDKIGKVEQTLLEVHPYETPAYTIFPTLNHINDCGLGIYGVTDSNLRPAEFVQMVKKTLNVPTVRTTPLPDDPDIRIRRVAMCGGSGSEFIQKALSLGAQVFISADIKYHDFVDYQDRILLIDAGHFETEAAVKSLFKRIVEENFPDVPVHVTKTNDNPINYI